MIRFFGGVVLVAAVLGAGVWIGRTTAPREEVPVTMTVERPMRASDLPTPSTPSTVTEYEAPDSANTRTDCITVPEWLTRPEAPPQKAYATRADSLSPVVDSSIRANPPNTSSTPLNGSDGLGYVITPTTGGRPRLSVTRRTVTFSGFLPTTGAGRTWTYDVPRPDWSLDVEAGIGTTIAPFTGTIQSASTTATLGLNRYWRDLTGRVGVGMTATTDRIGATVSLTLTQTLITR